ncbi:amidohydrolase family protein [Thalassotalea crassostreae]|uniref:amidohydrolase family protein n=1 Tax=Thalassotalea crassostreae TaxID=1763536 RepID=UPI000838276D|nr:amidohydrolase family protein [Thalassotalea crassostreae]
MKTFTVLLLILLVPSCKTNTLKSPPYADDFVLTNVNIIDVERQRVLQSKTVVVIDGKIDSIDDHTPSLSRPNINIIDGANGYITPGLIDMHVHMYEEAAYIFTLSHGVTHVRILNGVPKQLEWRDNIASGKQIGSSSTVSSPIISGNKDALLQHGVETEEEARAAIGKYHEQGYDLIKAYGNLNQTTLSAIIDESDKLAIPVAKHGPHASGNMSLSMLANLQSFEHVEDIFQGPLNHQFAVDKLPAVIADIKVTKVPVTPTLNIYYQLTKLSQEKQAYLEKTTTQYTPDIIALETSFNQVDRWLQSSDKMAAYNQKKLRFLQQITKELNKNDVPLLVGSDSGVLLSPHGIATHNEMRLLQQSGMSSYDVLAAATIAPAKALNLEQQIGKIQTNLNADFIFSKTNPINNLSILQEPEAVIKNGRWFSKSDLKLMRDQAIDSRSMWDEFWVLLEAI